jgi:histidinol-phosphate/aromatic aminotransferase/cobyric acid decarboxylase-like protein
MHQQRYCGLNKIKPPYNVNELTQQRALERLADKENSIRN